MQAASSPSSGCCGCHFLLCLHLRLLGMEASWARLVEHSCPLQIHAAWDPGTGRATCSLSQFPGNSPPIKSRWRVPTKEPCQWWHPRLGMLPQEGSPGPHSAVSPVPGQDLSLPPLCPLAGLGLGSVSFRSLSLSDRIILWASSCVLPCTRLSAPAALLESEGHFSTVALEASGCCLPARAFRKIRPTNAAFRVPPGVASGPATWR